MRNISQWSRKYFSPKWKSVSAGILSREEQIEKVYRSGVPPPASSRETSQSWLILSAEWDEILSKSEKYCLSETYFFVWVRNISFFEWEIFLCLDDKYSSERGRCQYISIISKPKYIWSHLFPVIYDVWSWLIYIYDQWSHLSISLSFSFHQHGVGGAGREKRTLPPVNVWVPVRRYLWYLEHVLRHVIF